MENIFVEFLPPWIETGLQPAFYDKESGTVLQQTARMYARVNMLIRMFNKLSKNTKTTVEDYINQFNELHDYVHDYFDNLDVQDEINNKLDEMADDGELTELILNYYSKTVDVIFPTYGLDGTDTLGDCSIIKTPTKVIMIDTFVNSADTFYAIQQALTENEINKIDILLITHYHADHYGNYQRLIDSGLINDARIILPKTVTISGVTYDGADIKEALTLANLTWEEAENETIDVDSYVTMELFNTSDSDYEYYLNNTTNYNDYCVCAEIRCFNKKMLFTADCDITACKHMTTYYIKESGYDLLKDPHHGLTNFSVEFPKKVCPKNVLVPASMGMIKKNVGHSGTLLNAWGLYTSSIYLQGGQNKPVIFSFTRENTTVDASVFSVQEPGSGGNWRYYVDSTTTSELRTGSEAHPFKNLAEANVMMPKTSQANLILNVLSLGSETDEVIFRGYRNLTINFNSHAPSNLIQFADNEFIRVNDVSLTSTEMKFYRCNNLTIQNFASTASATQATIEQCSKAFIGGTVTSSNATSCIFRITFSDVSFNVSTFNYTRVEGAKIFIGWNNNITFNRAFANILKEYPLNGTIWSGESIPENNMNYLTTLATLFESDEADYSASITLKESISSYKRIKIYAVSNNANEPMQVVEIPVTQPTSNNYCTFNIVLHDGSLATTYTKTCRINANKTTLTIDRRGQITTNNANPTTTSVSTGDNVGIIKVVGFFD